MIKKVLPFLFTVASFAMAQDEEEDKDDTIGLAFVLTFAAGLSTSIGAAFVFCDDYVTRENQKFLGGALGFASGIMIYIALVEILQGSFEGFEECGCLWDAEDEELEEGRRLDGGEGEVGPVLVGTIMFFIGVALVYILNAITHYAYDNVATVLNESGPARLEKPEGFDDKDEDAAIEDDDITQEDEEKRLKLQKMGILAALALGMHNLPEGIATFTAAREDASLGAALAFAIAVHNIPEGLCVAIPIYYATGSRWRGFWIAFSSGLFEIFGALIAFAAGQDAFGEATFGVIFGIVAGMMTALVLKEMIPTALKYDPDDLYTTNSIFVGAFVMAFSIILFGLDG